MTFKYFVGVDPGLTGGVAIIDGEGDVVLLQTIPTQAQGGYIKRRVDPRAFRAMLLSAIYMPALCAVESVWVRPTDTRTSGASLVQSAALAEGVLVGLGATVLRPLPQLWKRAMGVTGSKETSLQRARALWSALVWTDHNLAESALLARFCFLQRDKPLEAWEVVEKKKRPSKGARAKWGGAQQGTQGKQGA